MGRECSMHGADDKFIQILFGIIEGKNQLGDLIVDGRIILKCILKTTGKLTLKVLKGKEFLDQMSNY
jgi:hypothetical protein